MCGIAGIWNRDGKPVAPDEIVRFTRSLAHRGPDGEGTEIDDGAGLALGHRRLAILDPTPAGRQPMASADGRYRTTFNGEIYNFVEIRRELETLGYRFRTDTDTEVIAAAYDRWGEGCQTRFNGMWAFAIWDVRARRLFLSRDRFGVKPLLYASVGERFAFASELKAFLALDGFRATEYAPALARALDDPFGAEAGEETPVAHVRRLSAGHCAVVTSADLSVRRWWNTLDVLETPPRTFALQAERLRELVTDAARLRLRSDVPVAVALSGGLDSSSILGVLAANDTRSREADAREAPAWRRAFTATFAGTPLDERRYAALVAADANVPLEDVPVVRTGTPDEIASVLLSVEEITHTDPTPIWLLYRAMRAKGIVVALNGDGADELFGGYVHHVERALEACGGLRSPGRFLDLVRTRYHLAARGGPLPRVDVARLFVRNDPTLRALAKRARGLTPGVPRNGTLGFSRRTAIHALEIDDGRPSAEREARSAGLTPLGAHLYADFHETTLPGILRTFDRASMAHGVEVRNAFLDWRVVAFAFSLPDASKVGGGFTKRVVREAMRGIVPEVVRTRRDKIGFNAPLATWFGGPLREWIWARVNDPAFLESEIWNGPQLRAFVASKRAGTWSWSDGEALWPFLQAHLWRERFFSAVRDDRRSLIADR